MDIIVVIGRSADGPHGPQWQMLDIEEAVHHVMKSSDSTSIIMGRHTWSKAPPIPALQKVVLTSDEASQYPEDRRCWCPRRCLLLSRG